MILIKNVEYLQVDRDPYEICRTTLPNMGVPVLTGDGPDTVSVNEIYELVRGRRFCRPSDGMDITIGMTQEVQDILGIQYESWDVMQKNYDAAVAEWYAALAKTRNDRKATFLTRLKWLFCGYN